MAVRRIACVLLTSIIVVLVTGSPAKSTPVCADADGRHGSEGVLRRSDADGSQLAEHYDVWEVRSS